MHLKNVISLVCLFLCSYIHSAKAEKAPNEIFAETYWQKLLAKDASWFKQRLTPKTKLFSYQIGQDVKGYNSLHKALNSEIEWWSQLGFTDAEVVHVKSTYTRERIALESVLLKEHVEIPVMIIVDNTGARIDFIRTYYCYECLQSEKKTQHNPIFVSNKDLIHVLPPAAAEFVYRLTEQIKLSSIFTEDAFIINEKGEALKKGLLEKLQNEMSEQQWFDHSLTRLTFDGKTCVLEANINFSDSIETFKLATSLALDISSSYDSITRWAMYYPRNLVDTRLLKQEQAQAEMVEAAIAEKKMKNNRVKLALLVLSVSVVLYQLIKFITSNPT